MKYNRISVPLLMMVSYIICTKVFADDNKTWEKIKEHNGVIIYAQDVAGSDIVRVKTHIVINASMEKVQLYLDDLSYRKKWVPYLSEVRVLEQYTDFDKLEYSVFEAPWPASDRDFVYRQTLLHKDDKKIVFVLKVEESDLMPEQDGIVRAEMIESRYTLTSLGDNKTQAELIYYADPKGWLPDWVINKIQQGLPYRMLRNLKVQVQRMANQL